MHRPIAIFAALLPTLALPAAALAAPSVAEVASSLGNGVYVESGAEQVDEAAVRTEIARASDEGLRLSVIVLATDDMDPVSYADDVAEAVGGTVLIFTPSAFGASSDEMAQGDLNDAVTAAEGPASVEDATAAFVDAATASTNWALIIGVGLLVLLIVGVGGRLIERRATAERRQKALDTRWTELRRRADGWADPILDLSTRVELEGSPDHAASYREASELFTSLRTSLDGDPSAHAVDQLERDMNALDGMLENLDANMPTLGDTPTTSA